MLVVGRKGTPRSRLFSLMPPRPSSVTPGPPRSARTVRDNQAAISKGPRREGRLRNGVSELDASAYPRKMKQVKRKGAVAYGDRSAPVAFK